MKILWVPQISSLSKDNKVLLNKDSNMSVLRNLIDTDFVNKNEICVAFEFSKNNCVIDDALANNFMLFFDESRMFTNAFNERLNFNVQYFEALKNDVNPDIVFINEPTKVFNVKKIFKDAKIVTYNHWLAFMNMPDFATRQCEGMQLADLCFVNSYYARDEIFKYHKKDMKIVKAQPTFAGKIYPMKDVNKCEKAFIYNHRLSSDKYYKKAFDSLCAIFDILKEQYDITPTVYFTNPSGKDVTELFKNRPYFKEVNLETQEEYIEFIKSNKIIGHLNTFFESKGMWSMSTVDCARTGNICLLPNKFGYAEIFDKEYQGYCNDEFTMANKIYDIIENCNVQYDNSSISKHHAKIVGKYMHNSIMNMYENESNRPWGHYEIIYSDDKCKIKLIYINKESQLSVQSHKFKNEEWYILDGKGFVLINDEWHNAKSGDIFEIDAKTIHSFTALDEDVCILERSMSDVVVSEYDIERFEDIYGRA